MGYGLSLYQLYMVPNNIKCCKIADVRLLGMLLYHDDEATKEDLLNFKGFNLNQHSFSTKERTVKNNFSVRELHRICKILCIEFQGSLDLLIKKICCFLSNLQQYQYFLNNLRMQVKPLRTNLFKSKTLNMTKSSDIKKQLNDVEKSVNQLLHKNKERILTEHSIRYFDNITSVDLDKSSKEKTVKAFCKASKGHSRKASQKYLKFRDKRASPILTNEHAIVILKKTAKGRPNIFKKSTHITMSRLPKNYNRRKTMQQCVGKGKSNPYVKIKKRKSAKGRQEQHVGVAEPSNAIAIRSGSGPLHHVGVAGNANATAIRSGSRPVWKGVARFSYAAALGRGLQRTETGPVLQVAARRMQLELEVGVD